MSEAALAAVLVAVCTAGIVAGCGQTQTPSLQSRALAQTPTPTPARFDNDHLPPIVTESGPASDPLLQGWDASRAECVSRIQMLCSQQSLQSARDCRHATCVRVAGFWQLKIDRDEGRPGSRLIR